MKASKVQTDEDREAEDLDVAKFYVDAGNLNAAYLRLKDAVRLQPDDPEAHFQLASAADKMRKREEAEAEYSSYLKLDEHGKHVKAAQKALLDLRRR